MLNQRVKTRARQVLYFCCGYVFMVLAGYLSLPFIPRGAAETTSDITASIVRKYPLYIPMWTPFGPNALKVSPVYQLVVVWQAWAFIVLVSVFCCADCLLYSFIIFLHEAMRHLSRLSPSQRKPNQKSNLPEDEYKIWIRQHQFMLEIATDVENLFSPIILTTFLTNGFVMCVLAYVLVKISDIIGILCLSGHLSCIVAKLYVMARFGQILIDESTRLKSYMTFKTWPEMGRQRDAQIIGIRCSTPMALTGMKYFHLSVEFFGRVCSVALSYFIVLLQIH
ncbi:odorant receptor coreceptor-like [Cloeon dipterum]|uniref:odorant receptor coreceptor-like n=1 Tax=Cloeon dipterum TaxID=197152 RepID=UPI0032204BDC